MPAVFLTLHFFYFPKTTSVQDELFPNVFDISDSDTSIDTLKLLVWEGYAPDNQIKEFEQEIFQKYGRVVVLDVTYVGSHSDLFNPTRNKEVDIITLSQHIFKDERFGYIAKGLLLEPDFTNIPNFENIIPDLRMADYHTFEGEIYAVPVANGPYGLAYNTDFVPEEPDSWSILWEPEYKEKYCIAAEEYLYNVQITALSLGYPFESLSSFDSLHTDEIKSALRKLTTNANSFWIGVDKAEDLLGLSLGTSWGDSFSELERNGEIWKMASPKEGTLWWVDDYALTWALEDRPFMKRVAEEWINKTLSDEYQIDHLIREVGIYPVTTIAPSQLTDDEISKIKPEMFDTFFQSHILQQNISQRDRNGIKLLWEEAMEGLNYHE